LKAIHQDAEVLPAVGGAVEDLERPDFEEREDQALNEEEKVFEAIFERDPSGTRAPLYRPVPAVGRSENHLFRYFLDGSFRSYFLGTVLENERESPVHYAQIGACVLRREEDGSVRREVLQVENILLVGRQQLSDMIWMTFEELGSQTATALVDFTQQDRVNQVPFSMLAGLRARSISRNANLW
jgi:hypothetical protein